MNRTRVVCAGVSTVLLLWLLVLFFRSPTVVEDGGFDPSVEVDCASVVAAGWPGDTSVLQDKDAASFWTDHVTGGAQVSQTQREGIARDCADRRTTYVGSMVLIAIPTTVLAVVAIVGVGGRRRDLATDL